MLLAIDIGNTNVVLGIYRDEELLHSFRLNSDTKRTVDEFGLQVISLLDHQGIGRESIEQIAMSCVVPALSRVFVKLARKYFQKEALVVGPGVKTGIAVNMDDPRSVGSDRVVNALAARQRFGAPCIVVDFGTATTFDVVGRSGAYEGGVIAPGLLISAEALFERAALLTRIEIVPPKATVGKNTKDAMLSGIFFGYVALVDGLIARLKEEIGGEAFVVATGGLAQSVAEESRCIQEVVPELTLEGLKLIAAYNS